MPVALVVDDDRGTREFVARALGRHGWKTVAARSGQEALELLETQRFALIFLDLVMPMLDGSTTFRVIRERDPGAFVVVITAYPDSDLLLQALQVGPLAVMKKPFYSGELHNLLLNVRRPPVTPGARTAPKGQLQTV